MCTENQLKIGPAKTNWDKYSVTPMTGDIAANMYKQINIDNLYDSEWTDEQRIQFLVKSVKFLDKEGANILLEAQALKAVYDKVTLEAAEARAKLLKYGIRVDNMNQGN